MLAVVVSRDSGFFFSSRRRHTRSLCDWSSDVCSSDLYELALFKLGWTFYKQDLYDEALDKYMALLDYKVRSEEHTSELQSHSDVVCRLLPEKRKMTPGAIATPHNTFTKLHLSSLNLPI